MVSQIKSLQQTCSLQFQKKIHDSLHQISYTTILEMERVATKIFANFSIFLNDTLRFEHFCYIFKKVIIPQACCLDQKTLESVQSAFQLLFDLYGITDLAMNSESNYRRLNLEMTSTLAVFGHELLHLNYCQKKQYIDDPHSRSSLLADQRLSVVHSRSPTPCAELGKAVCLLHQEIMHFGLEKLRNYLVPIREDKSLLAALFKRDDNLFRKFSRLFCTSPVACTLAIATRQLDYGDSFNCCRDHKDVILAGICQRPSIFRNLSSTHRADFEIARLAVVHDGYQLQFADAQLKNDPRLIHLALMQNFDSVPWLVNWVRRTCPEDRALVLIAIQREGSILGHVRRSFQSDREIVSAAINQYSANLRFASDELRDDLELVALAVHLDSFSLQWASSRLQSEPSLIAAALRHEFPISLFPETLRRNFQFMLQAVDLNSKNFLFADFLLKDHRAFVLKAICKDPMLLHFVSPRLRGDREIVLSAFRKDIGVLQWACESLRRDRIFILEAIALGPLAACKAYGFADRRLKLDSKVLTAVLTENTVFKYLKAIFSALQRVCQILANAVRFTWQLLPRSKSSQPAGPRSFQS